VVILEVVVEEDRKDHQGSGPRQHADDDYRDLVARWCGSGSGSVVVAPFVGTGAIVGAHVRSL
jgi:hypothetical protein